MVRIYWHTLLVICAWTFCGFSVSAATAPFVIAPMIEGMGYCPKGAHSTSLAAAIAACADEPNPSTKLIKAALDLLEPSGATGHVHIGYTVGINLLGYMRQEDLRAHLKNIQAMIDTIDRPIVLYLMGNQFAALPPQITLPKSSFVTFSDQTIPKDQYFETNINARTLVTDPTLEVNKLRFGALKIIGQWYRDLPSALQSRVLAITLAGELHHFFPDFAHGLGRYKNIRVTDYSPASIKSFQNWLQNKYHNVHELKANVGGSFANFDAIEAPALDIRREKLTDFSQHFDAYAHGLLPIEGWLSVLPAGHIIKIYLDGQWLGNAEYGLSRQDVYEAIPSATSAGVGFRYWLDFSAVPRGVHTLQVLLVGSGKSRLLARRKIVLMGKEQSTPPVFTGEAPVNKAPIRQRWWLDQPHEMQDYYFNPLAKAWAEFRSHQVNQAYHHWFDVATQSGLPKDKLYSHQIAAVIVGTWNPLLTASDASITGPQPYKKGINLYAGGLNVELLQRHYLSPGEAFGVPEFHTQNWKNPKAAAQVFESFKNAGATFMSPYFVTIYPAKFRSRANPHDKFRIAPDNPVYGSNHLYKAIQEAASK